MRIAVPYFKQNTDYTCGPASLKMVISFLGKFQSEIQLAKIANTNEDSGTTHKNMVTVALKEGFQCYEKSGTRISQVKKIIKSGLPVIVNYIEPFSDIGHYAVIVGFEKENIIMNDPSNGKNFNINEKDFIKRWHSGNSKKWMLVISEEKLQF